VLKLIWKKENNDMIYLNEELKIFETKVLKRKCDNVPLLACKIWAFYLPHSI